MASKVKARAYSPSARLSREMREILIRLLNRSFEYAPDVVDAPADIFHYLAVSESQSFRLMSWEPARFIGTKADRGQTVALSRALRRLEQKGLVQRFDRDGNPRQGKGHTAFVMFTPIGRELAVSLVATGPELEEAKETFRKMFLADHPYWLRVVADHLDDPGKTKLIQRLLRTSASSFEQLGLDKVNHLDWDRNGN